MFTLLWAATRESPLVTLPSSLILRKHKPTTQTTEIKNTKFHIQSTQHEHFFFHGDSSSEQYCYSFGSVESEDLLPHEFSWKIQWNNKGYLLRFSPHHGNDGPAECWNSVGRADDRTTLLLLALRSLSETKLSRDLCNWCRGPWKKKSWSCGTWGQPWPPRAPLRCQRSQPSPRSLSCFERSKPKLWRDTG